MPGPLYKAAAIVGAAEANEIGFLKEPKSSLQLHIEAIKSVSEQTGIPISKSMGCSRRGGRANSASIWAFTRATSTPRPAAAVRLRCTCTTRWPPFSAGIIEVALISHGENGFSSRTIGAKGRSSYGPGSGDASPATEMTMAYGLGGAPTAYAHAMVRHFHRYGTTSRGLCARRQGDARLGDVESASRYVLEGKHPFGGPITIEQVETSRMITWPLTILHCCMVADHGGAVLVASPKVAAS